MTLTIKVSGSTDCVAVSEGDFPNKIADLPCGLGRWVHVNGLYAPHESRSTRKTNRLNLQKL